MSFLFLEFSCKYLEEPKEFQEVDSKIVSFLLKATKSQTIFEIIPDIRHLDDSTNNVINIINGTSNGLTKRYFKQMCQMVENWAPSLLNTSIIDQEFTPQCKSTEHELDKFNWLRLYFGIHWQLLKQVVEENKPLESLMPEE